MQTYFSWLYSALLCSLPAALAASSVVAQMPPSGRDLSSWWPQAAATAAGVSLSILLMLWKLQRSDLLPNARLRRQRRASVTLHDSLLQNVQGLVYRVQAAHDRLPEHPAEAARILEATMTQCEIALAESRSDFESCVVSDDATGGLLPMLRLFGTDQLEARNSVRASLTLDELGRARELVPSLKELLYKDAKAMIGASLAAAGVRSIEIDVIYETDCFSLRIRDDRSRTRAKADISACRNMLQRLRTEVGIDSNVRIWNGPISGLEIEISVPARMAYATGSAAARLGVAYRDD